jgi:two-component system, OmpR family, phosphate regulon sensor histidine kinase PhoR
LARSINLRLLAAVGLSLIPPTIALVVMAVSGAIGWFWIPIIAAAGAFAGGSIAISAGRTWARRAERLDAVAASLESRRPPAHLLGDARDPMGHAERRLLVVADSILDQLRSLGEQREELEAVLRGMIEAVVVTGRRGELALLNGAARSMFALNPDADYRGRDFVELCRDPRLQEFAARAMRPQQEQVVSAELLIQYPSQRHLQVNAAPIRSPGGATAGWVLVFHDISQLKSYETLRVDFIANLTHELRTPLSALCGYAETLLAGVEDRDTQRRFLGIIERQSQRLSRLIDDLISLSNLERGLMPLKIEPLKPNRVLEEAVELMREPAERQDLAVEIKCPADLPPIAGDHDRLHEVIINLLDNAIKYTPRGGRVTIEARGAAPNGAQQTPGIELIVADTGEGIPAADIPRLTERFYRVDRARSRALGGTGLGLAIVKHIVQLHHGRLKIESRLREGTTVTVWIPAAQS